MFRSNQKHSQVILLIVVIFACQQVHSEPKVGESRIVGGLPATDIHIPYIVSLVTYGSHICGGSIINQKTIITAAHCLAYTTARLLKVHAGTKTRSLTEGIVVPVESAIYHEQWSPETMDYDVGLIFLANPLEYNSKIQPIMLPRRTFSLRDGRILTVAGWGYTNAAGPVSNELRYAQIPLVNQETCKQLMGNSITERMLCAGYLPGGVDACQMDSGGPLVAGNKLVGLVSWGVGCAQPNRPGVYTRITALLPWISETLRKQFSNSP